MDEEELNRTESERGQEIHAVMSFVVALGVLLLGAGVAAFFVIKGVKAEQTVRKANDPVVMVAPITLGEHQVRITTQGVVKSRRQVNLGVSVSGRVDSISEKLIEGGRVELGDQLVVIDESDYSAAFARAEAEVADALLALEIEKAKAEQAKRDWEKLGRGEAPKLVMREPQINSAKARVESTEAAVERALLDVERTRVEAPFSGRVRKVAVEVGAVVGAGMSVAEIYSDTELEVRLPFPLEDFGFLRGTDTPDFTLEAELGGETRSWPASLDRIEGEVDRATLSGYGIAKVEIPEGEGSYPPVGLFVEAVIEGVKLDGVAEVPRSGLRGKDEVWVVHLGEPEEPGDEAHWVLKRVRVKVLRATRETLIVRPLVGTGATTFVEGDRLVLTRLNAPIVGMRVEVRTDDELEAEQGE